MAASISELIIAASVSPEGVRQGLDRARTYLEQFGRTAEQDLNEAFQAFSTAAPEKAGIEAGQALLGGLTSQFKNVQAVLNEQLTRGVISRDQFTRAGQQASQAFNQSILTGLEILRTRGLVEAGSDIERTLVQSLHQAGVRAGEANAQGISEGMARVTAGAGWPGRGPGLQIFDRNAAPAVTAIAFGFESLARSAASSESAVRAASRSVATFATGFGPGGVVITAVIAAGTALYEFWNRQKQQATEAREHLEAELGKLANAGDAMGLRKQAREAMLGTPFNEKGQAVQPSTLVQGAFQGSLADLRAQLSALTDQFYKETNGFRQQAIQQRIIDVKAQLAPLEDAFRTINEAYRNLASQESGNAGLATPITVTAKRGKPGATGYEEMGKEVERLTTAYQQLQALGLTPALTLQNDLERAFRRAGEALDGIKNKTSPAAVALQKMLVDLQKAMASGNEAALPGDKPPAFASAHPQQNAQVTIDRVNALRDSLGEFDAATLAAEGSLSRLLESVTTQIEMQGGPLRASNELLTTRRNIMLELERISKGQGSELWSFEDGVRLQKEIGDALAAIGVHLKSNNDEWAGFRNGIQGVLDGASGLGILNQQLGRAAQGALHLVESIRDIRKAKDGLGSLAGAGSAFGAIGGAISIVGTVTALFGSSPEEKERIALVRQNNERLSEVNASLLASVAGSTTRASAGTAAERASEAITEAARQATERAAALGRANPSLAFKVVQQEISNRPQILEEQLRAVGLTLDQFKQIAKDAGIALYDSEGRLVTPALQQLAEYLQKSAIAAGKFNDSLSDQKSLADLRSKVYGKDSPADALSSTIALLNQFAPRLGAAFDDLDTTTEEGRQKIETALQALFEQLSGGALSTEDYGTLSGAKDLAGIIDTLQTSLTSLAKSASSAAESLLYVPAGYRVALDRFEATTPVPAPWTAPPAAGPSAPGGSGGSTVITQLAPTGATDQTPYLVVNGDVLITAKDQSPDELFASVLRAAQRRAQALYGRTDKWANVQTPA